MASARSKQNPVGSAGWVLDERQHAAQCVDENVEEFRFAVSNELEWLNEHMSGILNGDQVNLTEAFKTPGKLRGKTPRTARKRIVFEERAPLTDVFAPSPNAQPSPAANTTFYKQISKFKIAEDKENASAPSPRSAQKGRPFPQSTVDSGYHDMTDEEPVIPTKSPARQLVLQSAPQKSPLRSPARLPQFKRLQDQSDVRSTGDTFVSAKETQSTVSSSTASNVEPQESKPSQEVRQGRSPDHISGAKAVVFAPTESQVSEDATQPDDTPAASIHRADGQDNHQGTTSSQRQEPQTGNEVLDLSPAKSDAESAHSMSESSSPARPAAVLRKKSSLTFATLPAREPLGTKKSMGARTSRTSHIDRSKMVSGYRTSSDFRNRASQPKVLQPGNGSSDSESDETSDNDHTARPVISSEDVKSHSKTSTQRLQERITMLGKMNESRTSKSITSTALPPRASTDAGNAADLKAMSSEQAASAEDDDWIGPMQSPMKSPSKLASATSSWASNKASSETASEESMKTAPELVNTHPTDGNLTIEQAKTQAAYPDLSTYQAAASTTPVGSPARPPTENALSASRSKLFSWARGIFAGSASTSAKAKQELLSSHGAPSQEAPPQPGSPTRAQAPSKAAVQARPMNNAPPPRRQEQTIEPEARRRSSARLKAQQQSKAPTSDEDTVMPDVVDAGEDAGENFGDMSEDDQTTQQHGPSQTKPRHKVSISNSQMSKHGDLRRPVSKQAQDPGVKGRPAPVLVRTASQRAGQPTSMLSSSMHETLAPQAQQKPLTSLKSKVSNQSMKSSVSSTKTSTAMNGARPKALEAAERKRLQDERDAQRKAEQRRELEKRKATKAEEERRQAAEERERKAIEQRELEAKNAAQRQAAEQRRQEAIRRNEQMRQQASHIDRPSSQQSQIQRPVSRMGNESSRPPVPHINPAKPPKRYWQPEEEEQAKRPPTSQKGYATTQGMPAAKRRRTSEVEAAEGSARPTTQPPIRMSTIKNQAPTKFQQGFMAANGPQSMLKTAVSNNQMQHPKTPHDMGKYSHAPPPFAGGASASRPQPSMYKTPGTGNAKTAPPTAAKSSPNYPNGDNISLPDIATDSEDSDEDDSFIPPDWANSPALRELLKDQQLVDPMKVFGPIAPISMEEVFKGTSKERQAKFRKRTSSAQWSGPDRLTEEERRRDLEAREKLQAIGRWTFDTSS